MKIQAKQMYTSFATTFVIHGYTQHLDSNHSTPWFRADVEPFDAVQWKIDISPLDQLNFVSCQINVKDLQDRQITVNTRIELVNIYGMPGGLCFANLVFKGMANAFKWDRVGHLVNSERQYPGGMLVCRVELTFRNDWLKEEFPLLPAIKHPFADRYKDPTFSDVKLKVGNKEINAHRMVLASASPVFAACFSHNTTEQTTGVTHFKEVRFNVLEAMVEYIYTGKVSPTVHLFDLLRVADMYQIMSLKAYCEKQAAALITADTALDTLIEAELSCAPKLEKRAIKCIVENKEKIMFTPEWENKLHPCPHLLDKVLKSVIES
jgi:hypothetical protein